MTFAKSARAIQWSRRDGSLLEFAEAHGAGTSSSCRSGTCETCSTRLLSAWVRYEGAVVAEIESGR
ncbi:hypothetical protein CIC12_27435 [Burkholderia sp. SG-MS1]|uniref:2Fe-2S iron-sulfur cluster-binding protein n=1 Tax=Paraburkholderia sp. SG-MS1 TaxID=2023741 RepID=UPI001445BDFB|nr:hypothetical protein [Paraburkholderia sp. SG-MS1]